MQIFEYLYIKHLNLCINVPFGIKVDQWVTSMYQSFFLMLKAVEFRPASGEIQYAFILYFTKANYSINFSLRTPTGNSTFHRRKKQRKKKELDVLRNKQENKNKAWQHSEPYPAVTGIFWPPLLPTSMEPTWSPFSGKAPIRSCLQGGLGSLPIASRKFAPSLYDPPKLIM